MTIPTTLKPGIAQLPDPCWTIALIDGGELIVGDMAPGCWASEKKAEAGIEGWTDDERRPAAFLEAKTRDYRCWTLTLVCGDQFVYEGEVDQTHFEDKADLLSALDDQGVVQVDGVSQYAARDCCEICDAAIGVPAGDRPIETLPDQAPMFGTAGDTIPKGWTL